MNDETTPTADLDAMFAPENDRGAFHTLVSPSRRYQVEIRGFATKPGCWDYTLGAIARAEDGVTIAQIRRNFSDFLACWVTTPDGREWFVGGASYMGQTVVDLQTGAVYHDPKHPSYEGYEFCWASAQLLADGRTLLVEGCHWACPYEYRLYDFTDPTKGWPELGCDVGLHLGGASELVSLPNGDVRWEDGEKVYLPTGERESEIEARYCARRKERDTPEARDEAYSARFKEIDHDDEAKWKRVVDHTIVLRRDGDKMVVVEEQKSEHLVERERRQAEWEAEWTRKRRHWQATDPIYLALLAQNRVRGHHYIRPSLVQREAGETNEAFFEITIDKAEDVEWKLSWGVSSGPIALMRWTRGVGERTEATYPREEFDLDAVLLLVASSNAKT